MPSSMIPTARISYADTVRGKITIPTPAIIKPAFVSTVAEPGATADAFPKLGDPKKIGARIPMKSSEKMLKQVHEKASYANIANVAAIETQKPSVNGKAWTSTHLQAKQIEINQEMGVVAVKPAAATRLPKKKNVLHRALDFIANSVLPVKAERGDISKKSIASNNGNTEIYTSFPPLGEVSNKANWTKKASLIPVPATDDKNKSKAIDTIALKDAPKEGSKWTVVQRKKELLNTNKVVGAPPLTESIQKSKILGERNNGNRSLVPTSGSPSERKEQFQKKQINPPASSTNAAPFESNKNTFSVLGNPGTSKNKQNSIAKVDGAIQVHHPQPNNVTSLAIVEHKDAIIVSAANTNKEANWNTQKSIKATDKTMSTPIRKTKDNEVPSNHEICASPPVHKTPIRHCKLDHVITPEKQASIDERAKVIAAGFRQKAEAVTAARSKRYGEDDVSWIRPPIPTTPKASPKEFESGDSIQPIFAAIAHNMPTPLAQKALRDGKETEKAVFISLDEPLDLPDFSDCVDAESVSSGASISSSITAIQRKETAHNSHQTPFTTTTKLVALESITTNDHPKSEFEHSIITPCKLPCMGMSHVVSPTQQESVDIIPPAKNNGALTTPIHSIIIVPVPGVESDFDENVPLTKPSDNNTAPIQPKASPKTPPERLKNSLECLPMFGNGTIPGGEIDELLDNFRPPSPEPWDIAEEKKKCESAKKITPLKHGKDPYELTALLLASEKKGLPSFHSKVISAGRKAGSHDKATKDILDVGKECSLTSGAQITPKSPKSDTSITPSSNESLLSSDSSISTKPTSQSSSATSLKSDPSSPELLPQKSLTTPSDPILCTHTQEVGKLTEVSIPNSKTTPTSTNQPVTAQTKRNMTNTTNVPPKHEPTRPVRMTQPQVPARVSKITTPANETRKELTELTALYQHKNTNLEQLPILTKKSQNNTPTHVNGSKAQRHQKEHQSGVASKENQPPQRHTGRQPVRLSEGERRVNAWSTNVGKETSDAGCLNGLSLPRSTAEEWAFIDTYYRSKLADIQGRRFETNKYDDTLTALWPETSFEGIDEEGDEDCDSTCSIDSMALTDSGFFLDIYRDGKGEYTPIDIIYDDITPNVRTFNRKRELEALFQRIIDISGHEDLQFVIWYFGDHDTIALTMPHHCTNSHLWSEIYMLLGGEGFDIQWMCVIDGRIKILLVDYVSAQQRKENIRRQEISRMIQAEECDAVAKASRIPSTKPPPGLFQRAIVWN